MTAVPCVAITITNLAFQQAKQRHGLGRPPSVCVAGHYFLLLMPSDNGNGVGIGINGGGRAGSFMSVIKKLRLKRIVSGSGLHGMERVKTEPSRNLVAVKLVRGLDKGRVTAPAFIAVVALA